MKEVFTLLRLLIIICIGLALNGCLTAGTKDNTEPELNQTLVATCEEDAGVREIIVGSTEREFTLIVDSLDDIQSYFDEIGLRFDPESVTYNLSMNNVDPIGVIIFFELGEERFVIQDLIDGEYLNLNGPLAQIPLYPATVLVNVGSTMDRNVGFRLETCIVDGQIVWPGGSDE